MFDAAISKKVLILDLTWVEDHYRIEVREKTNNLFCCKALTLHETKRDLALVFVYIS